jgi:hypothetical protein
LINNAQIGLITWVEVTRVTPVPEQIPSKISMAKANSVHIALIIRHQGMDRSAEDGHVCLNGYRFQRVGTAIHFNERATLFEVIDNCKTAGMLVGPGLDSPDNLGILEVGRIIDRKIAAGDLSLCSADPLPLFPR